MNDFSISPRRRLFGDTTDLEMDIDLVIAEACAEMGVTDYLKKLDKG